MTRENDPKRNASGCLDLTAYEAIKHADEDLERIRKLMGCLHRVCELAGFSIEERVILKDNRTGKIWR